jgi:CHAT domain-containing protein
VAGEGLVGLTRAFLYAGTPSIVVSLWSVNDESTADFMKVFYQNLKGGMSKETALRTAKKKLMEHRDEFDEPIYREPYYWAPFVLIGETN